MRMGKGLNLLTNAMKAHNAKARVQAEATALNVPVRFLHELRTLLPQPVSTDDSSNEEDAWSDPDMDSARVAEVRLSSSDSEEEGDSETLELQTALMAAPQMIAATSGTHCTYTMSLTTVSCHS